MVLLSNKALDDYDAEINRLQSQILFVEKQKQLVNDYKTRVLSLLSIFEQVPNEIVCVIFEFACTDNFLQEYPWPLDEEEPAVELTSPAIACLPTLTISAVCNRWRSLDLASPSLWSHLRLESAPATASDVQGDFMSTLQLYLDRSVDTPLMIYELQKLYTPVAPHLH
ncbi:hypothetical protein BT96DRAFT_1018352 [Gymnopus androsaceus JB14]|uniref:F-box domain-containing protein n=1 Tax=Gymnopus androsaceus JB14 TaxID=1447944 RepID=A0A6A4HPT5_9AGAR|nr:hypothetical protein BT96DRAFT_1018352 [Gymnopus androsaceus JB14]